MSFTTNIDEALKDIAESITLNESRIQRFQSSYNAILDLLKKDASFFSKLEKKINIFPQGSARLGTTIKPDDDDFDLDLVIHIDLSYKEFTIQQIYDQLWRVLSNDGTYSSMIEKKKRCIRIKYESDNYHMDILPALTFDPDNKNRLAVPDRKFHNWIISNPEDFADWFKDKATFMLMQEDFSRSLDTSEFTKSTDNPLKSAIKILKMYRNQYYVGDKEELKVPSVILTTLAAFSYKGGKSISRIITDFISFCREGIQNDTIKHFTNPKERLEIYSERWEENTNIYSNFPVFLTQLERNLLELQKEQSDDKRSILLKSMLSEEYYKRGFENFSKRMVENKRETKDFSGLTSLASSYSDYHKPYLEK